MSDLISRKAVLKLIWELLEISEYDGDKIIMVKDDIEKLPTAYDVDKVVEKLDKEAQILYSINAFTPVKAWECDKLIPIVKGGGRDE